MDPNQANGRRFSPNRQNSMLNSFNRGQSMPEPEVEQPKGKSREFLIRSHEILADNARHLCRTWVPPEIIERYPYANIIQPDQSKKLTLIEVCCTGYYAMRSNGVTYCRPICSCQNGSCRVAGDCNCYQGFVKNDNGDCVFTCPLGCQNGRCYLDGSCLCDPGFKLDESRRFCRPICSNGCGNNPRHNCTEPEVCGCATGFQLTDDGCQPVCDPGCGIGGLCRENNECDCGAGYQLKDGVCQTDCYQKCSNGICVSRNRCICDPGYSYHEQSTMCVPIKKN
ncbi:uncharacterized protein Dwil_GK15024 [Drosophila willistoni]|uniref:EGF-like domain-containing protein n=1 Tax=Drosophila willistoni TaxID=7260 RepID=B4MVN7_DROWI|nr:cell death abnormality protein 1 [Drosophila willistoni]EDW75757.2 uncharacterized protein Dwil_GK15024 [Drosophila willistoni]